MTRDDAMALVNEYVKHALDLHDDAASVDDDEYARVRDACDAAWTKLIDALATPRTPERT